MDYDPFMALVRYWVKIQMISLLPCVSGLHDFQKMEIPIASINSWDAREIIRRL